jgi:hypothetical protein
MRLIVVVTLAACTQASTATGTIGTWVAGPPLPTPRANHCSVAIDSWILAIGGNHADGTDFVKTDEIAAAELGADGTLGPWQVAGHTPSPVSECTATADGRTLYIIDGIYDDPTDGGQIFSADLDTATGQLAPLTAIGALPTGVTATSSAAAIHDQPLLVMDSILPADGDTTDTLRAPLSAMTSWSTDDWHIGFRAQAQFAFGRDFAYTLGGYHDPSIGAVADAFVAPIGADGTVGAPVTTTALAVPTAFGEAALVDDWLFVIGGRSQVFAAGGTTTVSAAHIAADGTIGAWMPATELPMPRTNHTVVLAGDYLVLTGGADTGGGDTTVLVAQARYSDAQ